MAKVSPFGDEVTVPTALTDKTPINQQSPFGDTPVTVGEDIDNIAPRSLRTGVELLAAGGGETANLAHSIPQKLLQMMIDRGWMDPSMMEKWHQYTEGPTAPQNMLPDLGTVRKYVTDPILGQGQDVQAQTSPGKFAQVGLETGPSIMAFNPGSFWSKVAQLVGSTLVGEGSGQALEEAGAPPWAANTARIVGGGLGAYTPSMINKITRPYPIPPERVPHIQELTTRNVPMTAGQITGSRRLRMKEDVAGGIPAEEQQGAAFTKAALKEQGGFPPGTDNASRPVMAAELDRMGNEFDRIQSISHAPMTQQFMDDLVNVLDDYKTNNPSTAPFIEKTINDIFDNATANNNSLSGTPYKLTSSKIKDVIRNTNDDGLRQAAMDLQDVLDNHIQAGLPANEQSAWRTVRAQYRNYLPIENAKASGGGSAGSLGDISPLGLKAGVKAIEGKREISSGDRGMTKLADAGAAILNKMPTSGTAERLRAQLAGALPLVMGGAAGTSALSAGLPPVLSSALGTLSAVGGFAYPAIRDAFIRSDFGQQFLARQGPAFDTKGNTLGALLEMAREAERQGRAPGTGGPR